MKSSLLVLVLFSIASHAAAQGDIDACIADHKRVQTSREAGHYLESLEAAARCAQTTCPQLIRQDCAAWYVDLADSAPSVVLDVRDDQGRDLADATVTLDQRALDVHGRAIPLDPGTHELHVQAPGFVPRMERIVLRQGERNRRIAIALQPALREHEFVPKETKEARTLSPAVITLAAIGAAGLGTFAALAITGKVKRSDLDDCKPDCARGDVDTVNHMYLGANVAAAIGGSAAIAATVLYALDRKRELRVGVHAHGVTLRGVF